MTDTPTIDVTTDSPVVESKKNDYENTIFKSAYWYAGFPIQLFVNHGVGGHDSFSFLIKKGKFTQIHNLTKDEKVPFVKAILSKMSSAEIHAILESIAKQ